MNVILTQHYWLVIEIATGKYLGTNTHTDDASAKLTITTIFLEQFRLQRFLGPAAVYNTGLFLY